MNKLTKFGLGGAVITAICCFTPLLVWLLVGLGMAGAVAWLDPILWPLLGVFLALMVVGYLRNKRQVG